MIYLDKFNMFCTGFLELMLRQYLSSIIFLVLVIIFLLFLGAVFFGIKELLRKEK